jgi:DNA-binding beta-propeller fold protein YncE
VTSDVTEFVPTTYTLTDTTSVTKTITATSTLNGIIPPINEVLISNISLPQYTWDVSVDPNTNMIYAVAPLSDLSVINGSTNHVVASVDIGALGSDYVAVDPSTDTVYSGNLIIDGATNQIIGRLPDNITNLVVAPNSDLIYALSPDYAPQGNTSLLIFSGSSDSLISKILINGTATILALNPTTRSLYIPICSRGDVCAPIYLIDLNESNLQVVSRILIDANESGLPFAIAVNPLNNMIYLTDQKLVSINGTTNTITAETTVSAFTIQCRGVAVNEMANEIYVAGWGFGDYGSFFIVNAQNYSLLNAFAGTGQPVGIAFDPTNSQIYVANSQTKSVLALNSTSFELS